MFQTSAEGERQLHCIEYCAIGRYTAMLDRGRLIFETLKHVPVDVDVLIDGRYCASRHPQVSNLKSPGRSPCFVVFEGSGE